VSKYKIIGSSSAGNAIIYFNEILIDVGLNYVTLAPHLNTVKIVMLTHKHGDHFQLTAISLLARERPDLLWIIPRHLLLEIEPIKLKNVTIIESNKKYRIGSYKIEAFPLYHDVENIGYKLIDDTGYKIVHATDTVKIDHIEAKHFDLYAIEHNYDFDVFERIYAKVEAGIFAHEFRSLDTHLSVQKAQDWINTQKKEDSEVIKLHMSSHYLKGEKNGSDETSGS